MNDGAIPALAKAGRESVPSLNFSDEKNLRRRKDSGRSRKKVPERGFLRDRFSMRSIEKGLEPDWRYTLAPASVANPAPRNFVSDGEQNFGGQMSGRPRRTK